MFKTKQVSRIPPGFDDKSDKVNTSKTLKVLSKPLPKSPNSTIPGAMTHEAITKYITDMQKNPSLNTDHVNNMLVQLQDMVTKLNNEPDTSQNIMMMNMQMNFMNMIHMLKNSGNNGITNLTATDHNPNYDKMNGECFLAEMRDNLFFTKNQSTPNDSVSSSENVNSQSSPSSNLHALHSEIDTTTKLIEKLDLEMDVNKPELSMPQNARFFIIKSFTEEDVHRAVKYKIWCSTKKGNLRLNNAWEKVNKGVGEVYLFFSVNASGHFCGVAKMTSGVDFSANSSGIWSKDVHNAGGDACKWSGKFGIEWLYIKDVPNNQFRRLAVPSNSYKPFPHSRDTQEIDANNSRAALKIFHMYNHRTSLLDDFDFYNKLEAKQNKREKNKKVVATIKV